MLYCINSNVLPKKYDIAETTKITYKNDASGGIENKHFYMLTCLNQHSCEG